MKITQELSKKLSFMFGFYQTNYIFGQKGNRSKSDDYSHIHCADVLPNQSSMLNFMYVICNEIEPIKFECFTYQMVVARVK